MSDTKEGKDFVIDTWRSRCADNAGHRYRLYKSGKLEYRDGNWYEADDVVDDVNELRRRLVDRATGKVK